MLAGCELYFGDGNNHNDDWNYCGSDGYYVCSGDNCEWQGPSCPAGAGSGTTQPGGGSGYECSQNNDCAAGCYCANGSCTEAGFCTQDSDCGTGYVCDTMRSSCVPGTPTTTCDWDNQCPTGQYCAPDHTCVATCSCTNDQQALDNGFGWCDETRGTCLPGQDPAGTCGGNVTCNTAMPNCPSGSVPKMIDGCYTGQCEAYGSCDITPVCSHINDQTNCLARASDCSPVYAGYNCTKPDMSPCQDGDLNCTCANFSFYRCQDKTASP